MSSIFGSVVYELAKFEWIYAIHFTFIAWVINKIIDGLLRNWLVDLGLCEKVRAHRMVKIEWTDQLGETGLPPSEVERTRGSVE